MGPVSRRSFFRGLLAGAGTAAVPRTARARVTKSAGPDDVGLLYDATRCIGCKACQVKCREVSNLPPDRRDPLHDAPLDLDGGTKTVVRLAVLSDGRRSFAKAQCMHCVDPACVSVCLFGALHQERSGVVAYDKDRCIGCRYCQIACPFDVPKFEWASRAPRIVKCELCRDRLDAGLLPGCVEVCPRQAIVFGKRADLLAEAHARLEAEPGKYQPKVYGERDGGGTHVLYLSALPFEALGLPSLGDRAMPSLTDSLQHAAYGGLVLPAALYAALGVVAFRNRRAEEKK